VRTGMIVVGAAAYVACNLAGCESAHPERVPYEQVPLKYRQLGGWKVGVIPAARTKAFEQHLDPLKAEQAVWSSLSSEQLVALVCHTDPALEKTLVGAADDRLARDALTEIDRRLDGRDLSTLLSEGEHEALVQDVRERMWRWDLTQDKISLGFAAKYDAAYSADRFLERPDLVVDPETDDTAFLCFARAGREKEAWKAIEPDLNALDEQRVCHALNFIGQNKVAFAADAVYARTHALRWLIRLQALRTLDQLDDPRAAEALAAHLADIRRHTVGHRILTLHGAFAGLSLSTSLRADLLEALSRRRVTGAADTFEAVLTNRWEDDAEVPTLAGVELLGGDRPRGVAVLRRMLVSGNARDQRVAAGVADLGTAGEVLRELRQVAQDGASQEARRAAAQAINVLGQADVSEPGPPTDVITKQGGTPEIPGSSIRGTPRSSQPGRPASLGQPPR